MHSFLSTFLVFFALAASAQNNPQPDYARDWKRADSLAAKGLPKSALEIATRIYKEAKSTRNYPQVARAAMARMIFRSYADEDAYVELVQSIRADIRDTPEPARSVLQSVLADIYWQYFQQNRYKFYNRATIGRAPAGKASTGNTSSDKPAKPADSTADFRIWDASQMVDAVTSAYLASVREKDLLQKTPVLAYEAVIEKGDADARPLRPTLYDLLAHRAIGFFQNTEPDLVKPTFKFELDQPAYLAGPEEFTKLTIQSRDSLSGRYQALLLYQQLLAFHLADTTPDALADADVLRLTFVNGNSVVPERDSIYRQTLQKQIARFKNEPAEAVYTYPLAEWLARDTQPVRPLDDNNEPTGGPGQANPPRWNRKQAADICRDLIKRFSKTIPGKRAEQLLTRLMQQTYSVQTEDVNAPGQPFRALVTYQSVNKVLYRIVRQSALEMLTYRDKFSNDEQRKKLVKIWLSRPELVEKLVALPDDGDLNSHSVEMPLAGLPVGRYLLLITTNDKFAETAENLQYVSFTVSSLGYVVRSTNMADQLQTLFVTNRLTGEPQKNALISVIDAISSVPVSGQKLVKTDADGRIKLSATDLPTQNGFRFLITVGTDTLLSDQLSNYHYYNNQDQDQSQTYAKLFTDRAIYRPGQIIYVKGLIYEGKTNQYSVVANRDIGIELLDNNRERINKQELKTNEFGTFTLSFVAPIGRLTGTMTIQTAFGSTSIRVEEYKRPTFEVKAKPIQQAFKLGQTVSLTAEAKTYSGAVVDGASVRYRVVRQLRPRWDWWYSPRIGGSRNTNQTEITNGIAQTDAQGKVSIAFVALPDREQIRQDNPVFEFEVTIDVTDRAGETRSATQTLRIGYSALQADLIIPAQVEMDKPTSFPLRVTNQSGTKVAANGQLNIYRLKPPTHPLRNRLWSRPDRQLLSRAEFEKLFPDDLFTNENDPRYWPKGDLVQQQAIKTPSASTQGTSMPGDSLIKPDLSRYTAGEYVAELSVTDSTGETAKERVFFAVVNDRQPTASARIDDWIQVRKATAEPSEDAIFWVGNSQPGWVLMTVEGNHVFVRQEWIKTDGRPRRVALPVTEKLRGGFAVHFAMIQNGRLYQKTQIITVPFTNKQLTIETKTFRSKLKPGEREEWTLTVSGLQKSAAEMVATMYDASLDTFAQLNWPTSFYRTYSPSFYGWQSGSFDIQRTQPFFYRYRPDPAVPTHRYDQLSWLGYRFSLNGGRLFRHDPIEPFGESDDAIRIIIRRVGKVISGTAKNKDGLAVPGVNVLIKGTDRSAVFNAKGQIALVADSVNNEITLVFSNVGYVTNEVTIKRKVVSLSFQLMPDVRALNEVVVVGYSTQARRDVTGAVSTIKAKAAPMAAKMSVATSGAASDMSENEPPKQAELINPRRNFNETAFFLPQLNTDAAGRVVLKFTMPEALTRWRLLAFAHTKDLKTGTLEREIITQKELMISANSPRFLREGDTIRLTARINNLTQKALSVTASLALLDALTGEPINQKLTKATLQSVVSVAAGQGQVVGWTLVIPAGLEAVTCRLTAQAGSFTDGEEFTVPVLPNRMLITDTQPFWINGSSSATPKTFKLKELTDLNSELPVQHERLTVEVTSNPSWYALQALPYLMEYRYECAEQLFSRLYANSLAAHIVNSKPAFRQVISEWQKNPPRNPLQANEELKAVALENSPWLVDARSEADRQAKLGQLLDANRMESEQLRAFEKLQELQTPSGGFRWFGGMEPNLSITLHILSGLGHLQKLGVQFPKDIQANLSEMQTNAVRYADAEIKRWVDDQKKAKSPESWYFSATQYLYARSFYVDKPMDKTILAYLKQRVADNWLNQSLQGQALSAMALSRFGDTKTAVGIINSMRERSRKSEELGTYWPDNQSGLYWYQTPIETQAYLIEAFGEISPVLTEVDDMKRWLLRQKQTQSWSSTKATTEAVYALLLRGTDWLGTGVTTQVSLGGQPIENRVMKSDAITGYEKVAYAAAEIKPEMGTIQITKKNEGPAWGALYWQHFEPLDRVMPGSAGLSVQKALYVQHDSPGGPISTQINAQTPLKPGDLIKVRLILKTDRTMEYVHLKDGRASGFEPVAALSGYKYQNGLGYYESPRDASTDFFMSYLPVGTHVFEYDLRVAQTGDFSAGVATVQCFYAPEFSAHSAGERVQVK